MFLATVFIFTAWWPWLSWALLLIHVRGKSTTGMATQPTIDWRIWNI
jgi:hypothetical protein